MTYPHSPGFKGRIETGRDGARAFAPKLAARQAEALDALRQHGPATADAIAAHLERHWYVVRPRFSELRELGLIVDTGERQPTEFGGKTWVARIATAEEFANHIAARAANDDGSGEARNVR